MKFIKILFTVSKQTMKLKNLHQIILTKYRHLFHFSFLILCMNIRDEELEPFFLKKLILLVKNYNLNFFAASLSQNSKVKFLKCAKIINTFLRLP